MRKPFLPMLGLALALGTMTALSACAPTGDHPSSAADQQQTSAQAVYAAAQSYTVAAREETSLIQAGMVSKGTALEMKRLDNVAYSALRPVLDAARAGQTVSGRDAASAQAAVAAFSTFIAQNGGRLTQ